MMLILDIIHEQLMIVGGKVLLGCDNIGGLTRRFTYNDAAPISSKHFDILWEIHRIRERILIEINYKHVEGHQSIEGRRKDRMAEMNHQIDLLAKDFLSYCMRYPATKNNIDISNPRWSVWMNNDKVCQNLDETIKDTIFGRELFGYWTKNMA